MNQPRHSRIDWVDHAKGICIILVVMMHSTLGVEKLIGEATWLNGFIEWARPFRMPDFFMISGLFLAARIDRPWRDYLDSKVLHFAYFYLLWMTIQFGLRSPALYQAEGARGVLHAYALGFVDPYGTLWFIYLLAVFFVAAKALRRAPPLLVFAVAALLEMAPVDTGWMVIDEFAARFVYFFAGYWLAARIFGFAAAVGRRSTGVILGGLAVWAAGNAALVAGGLAHLPGLGLALGFVGATAVVSTGVLLARSHLAPFLRYCGENSIVIYLAFPLFMGPARSLLLKTGIVPDMGLVALTVTAAGVIGPVLMFWAVRHTPLAVLFRRPAWAKLASERRRWHTRRHVDIPRPQAR